MAETVHHRCYRFAQFILDPGERQLWAEGRPVALNNRYFDALTLLVRAQGQLVSKDRLLDEVWRGVPVTDEALTQCIRILRRQLEDDAARPRFIETVPKHGYRFIAPVRQDAADESAPVDAAHPPARPAWFRRLILVAAGTAGGAIAGVGGGLLYGFTLNLHGASAGMGASSTLVVLLAINMLVGLIGGAGVSLGIALADAARGRPALWSVLGGGAGGLLIGAVASLIGHDVIHLLFGHAPREMTGGGEGALLGAAIGLAAWWTHRMPPSLTRAIAAGATSTGAAGLLITASGGRLLGGSLDALVQRFPSGGFRLDSIGMLFGEPGFGPISRAVTGAVEGGLFGACMVAALHLARTVLDADDSNATGRAGNEGG